MTPEPGRFEGDAYIGRSEFLLWAPKVMLVFAVLVYLSHWNHSIHVATLFVVTAFIHSCWGRRPFVAKTKATVRVDLVGAFVLLGARRRFGYPLLDGILYQPGHQSMLRAEFLGRGYDVS